MATPSFTILRSETTQTSITIRVYNYGYYIRLFLKNNATGDVETTGYSIWPELQDYTFSGLEPGTSYTINLGYNTTGSGGSTQVGAQTETTKSDTQPAPDFYVTSITANSAVMVIDNEGEWHLKVYLRKYGETDLLVEKWLSGTPTNPEYEFTGLTPDTRYVANLGYNNTGSGASQSVYGQDGYIFRTEKAGLTAYIYDNSYTWHLYLCYLYSSAGWTQYQPTIGGST